MFDQQAISEIVAASKKAKLEPAGVLAVAEVESAGKVFAKVGGRNEPLIRFEGHYFYRLLSGVKRDAAVKAGLASPKMGAVKNPATQAARHILFQRAMAIDTQAAIASTSWGLGQVMGDHWKSLGYGSALDLMNEARSGAAGQVRLMIKFIVKNGLGKALNTRAWSAFARRYNGPSYRVNAYDTKMAAAAKRWDVKLAKMSGLTDTPNYTPAPAPLPQIREVEKLGMPAFRKLASLVLAAWAAVLVFLAELPCKVTGWDYFCN